jgi:hypothetical protein
VLSHQGQHALRVGNDVGVGQPQDAKSACPHVRIAARVVSGVDMRTTVRLYDELGVMASDVRIVRPDRHLSAEVVALLAVGVQQIPQPAFDNRRLVPQSAGAPIGHLR